MADSSEATSTLASLVAALTGASGPNGQAGGTLSSVGQQVNRSSQALAAALVAAMQQQEQQQQQQQQTSNNLTTTNPTISLLSNLNLTNISEEEELKLLNFPSKREDLSTAIPLTVIFALLLVTGCIGNLCTAIVIARPKNKYMHTATNYYLFSLAMSDFLFLILGLPQEMYQIWQRYPYVFGETFCIIRGYMSEASTYASILTISAFTIERYVAICHPLWAHTMSQLPRAITSIVIIWCLAAICAIPPAAELGIMTQRGPITNRTLEQSAQCATKRTIFENMFVVSAIVFFIVPMIIVTVLYILIAIELRRSSKMNSAISKQTSSHLHTSSNSGAAAAAAHSATTCRCCAPFRHQAHCPFAVLNGNTKTPDGRPQKYKRNGHLASRSQQHLSLSICDSQTNKEANQSQSQNQNQHQRQASSNSSTLMANIMSQRPSSAIGSFEATSKQQQQQQDLPSSRPTTPFARLWPLVSFWAASGSQANVATCGCRCHLTGGGGQHLRRQQLQFNFVTTDENSVNNNAAMESSSQASARRQRQVNAARQSIAAQHCNSLGDLYTGSGTSVASAAAMANKQPLDGPTAATNPITTPQTSGAGSGIGLANQQQHSPLSYHESLIQHQRQQLTSHHNHLTANHQQQQQINQSASANGKLLHPLVAHQMSLTSSALGAAGRLRSAGSVSSNQHVNQKQQLYQYQLAQQQQQQRRSRSAASSKKSVVRMLVAVVVSFFICWVPFHAQRLLASYLVKDENQNQVLLDIYLKLTYISGVMYYLSSTINPLLYQLMSAKFRLAFKETFNCSLFKCAIFSTSKSTAAHSNNTNPHQAHHNYHLNASGHSPTNSLKDQQQQVRGYLASRATGSQHLSHWDSKASELNASQRGSGGQLVGVECLCSPSPFCGDTYANGGCRHPRAPPLSAIARLRGRINSSVSSLFRFSGASLPAGCQMKPETSLDASCDFCACSANLASQGRQVTGDFGDDINNNGLDRSLACKRNSQDLEATADGATPLLSHSERNSSVAGPNSQSRLAFPAHSMLKFVRSPTGSACHLAGGADQCLTRLSSHGDEDQEQEPACDNGSHAIEATKLDSLIRATLDLEEDEQRDEEPLVAPVNQHNLTTSGSSGNSSGSSPDQTNSISNHERERAERRKLLNSLSSANSSQHQREKQQVRIHSNQQQQQQPPHSKIREKGSTGSSSSGGNGRDSDKRRAARMSSEYQKASSRRRRSLQQMHNSYLAKMAAQSNGNPNGSHEDDEMKRRKSSSSSANHNQRHHNLSSSLSSSERQLDKKLSLSTTTSALEDYGSYTTTNSQLTGVLGSNAQLSMAATSRRESFVSSPASSSPPSSTSSVAIEEDPATVIPKGAFCLQSMEPAGEMSGADGDRSTERPTTSSTAPASIANESLVPLLAAESCALAHRAD